MSRLPRAMLVFSVTICVAILIRLLVRWVSGKLGSGAGDLVGLLNLFAFLVAGGAIAALARRYQPGRVPGLIGHACAITTAVLLFLIGPWLDYRGWLDTIAQRQQVDRATAVSMADEFLQRDLGARGFVGFYRYSARHTAVSEEAPRKADRLWITETLNLLKYTFYLATAIFATIFALHTVTDTTDIGLAVLLTLFAGDD